MSKSFIKILSILLIVGLNWAGLSAVIETLAYMNDTESSPANSYSAGTLDLSLSSPQDFFPPTPDESNQLIRNISVINEGNLNFKYQIRVSNYFGKLCKDLKLEARQLDGTSTCPIQDLKSFNCGLFEISDSTDDWQFTASLPEGFSSGFIPKSCEFKLVFEAWQTNLTPSLGFSDVEEIESKVTKHISDLLPGLDIVINEFLPDPVGPDNALAPHGEWVELYNKGSAPLALNNWYFMDLDGKLLPIPTSTVAPKGFLVVYLDGAFSPEWLDNTGDGLALLAPQGVLLSPFCFGGYCLVDVHFFTGAQVIEGKSFARIPDGSNIWYDPIPTPGEENQLSEEEIMADLQPEVIELDQEQLFQMFIEQLSEEPISDEIGEPVVEEEPPVEEESTEEEVITEENQEQGGIIEEINEIIDEVIDEIVDEIMPDEETGEEVVEETEALAIEDVPIIEEAPADETPAIEEQPATEEQPVIAPADNNSGEQAPPADNSSSGGDSGGGDSGGGETLSAAPSDGATA